MYESTCPRITAGPSCPGVGPYLYHPTLSYDSGTSTVLSALSPSGASNVVSSLLFGISRRTGCERENFAGRVVVASGSTVSGAYTNGFTGKKYTSATKISTPKTANAITRA